MADRRIEIDDLDYSDLDFDNQCGNCGGIGMVPGCFEDCCSGADCDPEDAEYCCAPSRCDWCNPAPRNPGLDKALTDALAASSDD